MPWPVPQSPTRHAPSPLPLHTLQTILIVAPILLFSMIAHEYAHGYAALRQGDSTARDLGRLTWNPIRHIDPFMTILLPLIIGITSNWHIVLGGAKPVPVNPRNYRNYKRGDIIVSLAGVTANLAIAVACVVAIAVLGVAGRVLPVLQGPLGILQAMLIFGIWINLLLLAFNLIPIPPLDGSHVMKYLMPASWAVHYQALGRYGIIILVALLWFGGAFFTAWLQPVIHAGSFLLGLVGPFVVPGTQRWIPQ